VFTRARYRLARAEAELFPRLTGECADGTRAFPVLENVSFQKKKKGRNRTDPFHASPWRIVVYLRILSPRISSGVFPLFPRYRSIAKKRCLV